MFNISFHYFCHSKAEICFELNWGSFNYNMWKLFFFNSFCLFQNFSVKVRVYIFRMLKFWYYASSTFSYSDLSGAIYLYYLVAFVHSEGWGAFSGIGCFSIKNREVYWMKKPGKNEPYFKTVLLNTKFFIWIVYSTHTDIKVEFECLRVLDAPMNLL